MSVRAKFTCYEKIPATAPDCDGGQVKLRAVIDGSAENEAFFHYTPYGELSMGTINQAAFDQFEVGKQYYLDISSAEVPTVATREKTPDEEASDPRYCG
jgi:hypothetical protein